MRVFADALNGRTIARSCLDTWVDKRLVLVFTDGSHFIVNIECGWYGETALVDSEPNEDAVLRTAT